MNILAHINDEANYTVTQKTVKIVFGITLSNFYVLW